MENQRAESRQGGFHISDITMKGVSGIHGTLCLKEERIEVLLPVVGQQSLYPLLAAAAVGAWLGVSVEKIRSALETWQQPPGRMSIIQGINNAIIINDSYNASPEAVRAALSALYALPAQRRIAILGSMNELGEYAKEGHELVGINCGKLDYLITVGDNAKAYIVPFAIAAGVAAERIRSFMNPVQAGEYVSKIMREGDAILVKGSQNHVFTEEAIPPLLKNKDDRKRLVRQGEKWQRIKRLFIDRLS